MSEQLISGEKLCSLTGLTDRRHRQIAKEGYFPPPIKGQYQLAPTLQGMFKYYRELGEYRKNKREQIDDEKHRKLKLENDETEGRLTDTQILAEQVAPVLLTFRDSVYTAFEVEAPRSMCGIGVPEARIVGRRMGDALLENLQHIFDAVK